MSSESDSMRVCRAIQASARDLSRLATAARTAPRARLMARPTFVAILAVPRMPQRTGRDGSATFIVWVTGIVPGEQAAYHKTTADKAFQPDLSDRATVINFQFAFFNFQFAMLSYRTRLARCWRKLLQIENCKMKIAN
jgi:hypothetical protein